jgi:hypothetical protein
VTADQVKPRRRKPPDGRPCRATCVNLQCLLVFDAFDVMQRSHSSIFTETRPSVFHTMPLAGLYKRPGFAQIEAEWRQGC